MRIKLQYLVCDTDRHGNARYYVRAPGQRKVRIKAVPLTEAFMEEYSAAIAGVSKAAPGAIRRGSFRELSIKYFASGKFKSLDMSTRNWQRRSLESICQKYGTVVPVPPRLFAVEQRNLLFLLATCPQLVSLLATLPARFASLHTSPHAASAPLLTPLCARHRGGRSGGLLGLGI